MFHYSHNHEHQPAYMTPASTPAGRIHGSRVLSERTNAEESRRGRSRDERMNDPYIDEEEEDYILCSPILPQKPTATTSTLQGNSSATCEVPQLAHYGHRDNTSAAVEYVDYNSNETFKERLDTKEGIIASLEEKCHWLENRYLEMDSSNILLEQKIRSLERRCKVVEGLNRSLEISCKSKEERIAVLQDAIGQLLEENQQRRNEPWVHYSYGRDAADN